MNIRVSLCRYPEYDKNWRNMSSDAKVHGSTVSVTKIPIQHFQQQQQQKRKYKSRMEVNGTRLIKT